MAVEKVLLASPRGFCAGVEMAIKALAVMVSAFEPPVYCYHEIVHNKLVVKQFEALGVVFVDDIAEVPSGAPLMLSAHGSAPEVQAAAYGRGGYVVDSVCPLVTKVHHEVRVRAGKGYRIVYVGHEGHEEAVGTMAVAPEAIHRVESVEDVAALPEFDEPVALLAQTTLSHRDWAEVADSARERFPDMWTPGRSDLCFATTNRQAALAAIAERCDVFVIVGSANSSNTLALERVANDMGCPRVLRVNLASELPDDLNAASDPSPLRTLDPEAEGEMIAAIDAARAAGDTVGGCFEVVVRGLPVGLGSYVSWDRKLDGRLAQAVMSVHAIKGVEIGPAFINAGRPGSRVHDAIVRDSANRRAGGFARTRNRAGGLEGGITTGADLVIRGAMKPISTLLKNRLPSVDLRDGTTKHATVERSDVCAVPAAAVVAEAMVALVAADALLEKFGGDSLSELCRNLDSYLDRLSARGFRPRGPEAR